MIDDRKQMIDNRKHAKFLLNYNPTNDWFDGYFIGWITGISTFYLIISLLVILNG